MNEFQKSQAAKILSSYVQEDTVIKGGKGSGRKKGFGNEGPIGTNPYTRGESVTYHKEYGFGKQGSETAGVVMNHPVTGHVLLDNGDEMHHLQLQYAENKHLSKEK